MDWKQALLSPSKGLIESAWWFGTRKEPGVPGFEDEMKEVFAAIAASIEKRLDGEDDHVASHTDEWKQRDPRNA